MDKPITDIVFVCTPEKAPKGYKVITQCPCGHDAQLWEKVLGGVDGKRYLCFTKEEQSDGKLVEDMYIPGPSQQYLKREYKIITDTVEGEEPMWHKQLAVKKVPAAEAEKAVVDVIVSRSRDKISKLYTKMTKVNGLRIAFRTGNPNPSSTGRSMDEVSSKLGGMAVSSDSNARTQGRGNLDEYSPASSSSSHSASPVDPAQYNPSPSFTPPDGGVSVKRKSPLGSSLPPSAPLAPPPQPAATQPTAPPLTSAPPAATQVQFPVTFDDTDTSSSSAPYKLPAHAPPTQTQVATPTPYTPAAMTTPPTSYPPAPTVGGGYNMAPAPYPPQNQGAQLPYQMYPTGPPGQFYTPTASYGQQRGVAPSAPPSYPTTGYDTNIGFSFGGTAPPPGPVPYNPYHHQQQQQQQYGGSSSTPIYPPQAQSQHPGPPSKNSPSYGFNFN